MHFCFKLHVIVIFALYFYYAFIIPAVKSKIQSFILVFILHYVFDMFVLFVYDNVAMFHLFQLVSKCNRATLCLRPIRPWPWGATALGGAKFVENKFFAKRFW